MKWWIVSKTIFKTWQNALKKGLKINPLLALLPLFAVAVVIFYFWMSYNQLLNLSQASLFSGREAIKTFSSGFTVLTFLATCFGTILLLQFSPPRREFLKIFLPLPLSLGDILFGYSIPFILLLITLVLGASLPVIVALNTFFGIKWGTVGVIGGYLLLAVSSICLGLLFWALGEIGARKILGEQGEQFIKILMPFFFLIFPLLFLVYSSFKAFFDLFSKVPFFPTYWFITFLNYLKDSPLRAFLSLVVLAGFSAVSFIFWFLITKLFWQSTTAPGRRIKFLKKIPFFSARSTVNISLLEVKQSLRNLESLGFLLLLAFTFLFLSLLIRQVEAQNIAFQAGKFTLYLLTIALGAFALLSRPQDAPAEWLLGSLPLTFGEYAIGKWLGNVFITLAFFWLQGIFFLSLTGFSFRNQLGGVLFYSADLIMFVTLAYLCGTIYKIKRESAVDQLLLGLLYGIFLLASVTFLQQAIQLLAELLANINIDLMSVLISLLLSVILLMGAVSFEGLRRVS